MAQGVLPYQYQGQMRESGMTALGGLPVYLDLAQVAGLSCAKFATGVYPTTMIFGSTASWMG